ncbi:MAG: RagB/SusD family nutrient uptake outer membrane protein [Dysgonamonadaceae bacterium]|nr:RagB/SusD family nutrient uptake outer membrane protein [Dysgonamonadaceae bacterium]
MKINSIYKIIGVLLLVIGMSSCSEDFLSPDVTEYATKDQINDLVENGGGEGVVNLMKSTMLGAYNAMITYQGRHDAFSEMSVRHAGDLMTEDMVFAYRTHFIYDYDIDNNSATYARPGNTWSYLYSVIGKCNEVIEKVPLTVTDASLKAVLGEALALRAYAFLSLVQRFQQTYKGNEDAPGIPLTLTSNDDRPTVGGRGTVRDVYDKILTDLDSAVIFLPYRTAGVTKTSIDKSVAAGIFARALMVVGDWDRAAQYANLARQNYLLMSATEVVNDNFGDINNKEWMWGADITTETTTMFASFFSHVCSFDVGYAESTFAPKMIDARLYSAMSNSDVRKEQFKDPAAPVNPNSADVTENAPAYCNYKFKKVTGWLADYIYMRASEMYLIEAEALAQQGKNGEAYNVLKILMDNRDPNWANNRSSVTVEDVFLQKRLELWGEGHIFYDYLRLKKGVDRTYSNSNHMVKNKVDAGSWKFIYQLPQTEIDNNEELTEADQNPLS